MLYKNIYGVFCATTSHTHTLRTSEIYFTYFCENGILTPNINPIPKHRKLSAFLHFQNTYQFPLGDQNMSAKKAIFKILVFVGTP